MSLRLLAVFALLLTAGCRGGTSDQPPVLPPPKVVDFYLFDVVNMNEQPKYKAQEQTDFWPDGRTMRLPPEDTIARGGLKLDNAYFRGVDESGQPVTSYPVEVTASLVERGQERYDIFCAPCHDKTGSGKGLVPTRGWIPPPTFHQDSLRAFVPGQLYQVIQNGVRTMPSYAKQIPEQDRWAIVAYVQALQRSHFARREDVPADQRNHLR